MEIEILKWFDTTFHSEMWFNYVMKYVTFLGEFGLAPILVAVVLLAIKKTRAAGLAAGIGLILNLLIVNVILKTAVNRPRPWTEWEGIAAFYDRVGVRLPTDSSFPSGHTATCFCVAVALLMKYKLQALPALVIAFIVGFSRIYLCVHYPTDVLAGALIGSVCGVAGYFSAEAILRALKKRKQKKNES